MSYTLENRQPSILEYQKLRASTDWLKLTDEQVGIGLSNSLFAVCVVVEKQVIGSGRVIGDGAMYFYIQDIIVLPDFRGKGFGDLIMKALEVWINEQGEKNAFVGLMSADGYSSFYQKYNYQARSPSAPGMFKVIHKKESSSFRK